MGHEGHDHEHEHPHDHEHDRGPGHEPSHPVSSPAVREWRGAERLQVPVALLTVSDGHAEATDRDGEDLAVACAASGHPLVRREQLGMDPDALRAAIARAAQAGAHAVIVTGGTGVAPRERTIETLRELSAVELESFAALCARLLFEDRGSAAIVARSFAGLTADGTLLFGLPDGASASRLVMEKLIAPELGALARAARAR